MKLSAPKTVVWWISVIVGVVGILFHFGVIAVAGVSGFWLVAIAFILLGLATFLKGL